VFRLRKASEARLDERSGGVIRADANRIPVIIGVGQINDRPADPAQGLDPVSLMLRALELAEQDAGCAVLDHVDWLGVEDQISFPDPEFQLHLARQMRAPPRRIFKTAEPSGDGPLQLISDAANLIGAGEIRMAALTGAEALRTANKRAQADSAAGRSGDKVDKLAAAAESIALPLARRYGMLTPTDIYPLYEHATRQAWGQSFRDAELETAMIWSGLSRAAAANPAAWQRTVYTPEQIATVTDENRMVSFPYTKLMVANMSVNQGAALLIASLSLARELKVPESQMVYLGRGAAAAEPEDFLARDSYRHSAALSTVIQKTLEFNELSASDIHHVEFYSCFPCIPKLARRALPWPLDKPHSVYGGLSFGGGPVGNCMMHAAAVMVEQLRAGAALDNGILVANGGYATHCHGLVLSRGNRGAGFPQDYSVQSTANLARGPVPPIEEGYSGPASIETFSVPYGRAGTPAFATVLASTPTGHRVIAHVPRDSYTVLERLTDRMREPVGMPGTVSSLPDGRRTWNLA
jgi:acetyl-CoA C-acetyltransferase